MNPPYSQGSKDHPSLYEICFIRHLLNSVLEGGRVAVIVPISTMIGKSKEEREIKKEILKSHTLEGVISCNKNTFYGVGTVPCIAVFTCGKKHPADKLVRFVNFEDDGFEVKKHLGLVETERAEDRRKYLLKCWRGEITEFPSKFMVKTEIKDTDEWIHSFYYYNDEIPTEDDFMNSIADYLTFEFNMIAHGKGYLFGEGVDNA
jgi:type I restriction-modification system DNA methylase subunit